MTTNPLMLAIHREGLTIADLAYSIDMPEQSMRRKCAGGSKFTDIEMLRIGKTLRLTNDEFVTLWVRFTLWRDKQKGGTSNVPCD